MKPRFCFLLGSFCAFILLAAAACSQAPPAASNNQNTDNANTAPSKPANSNSPAKSQPAITGSIEITSVPPGAGVALIPTSEGGAGIPQSRGSTPATITDLAPGIYTISVEKIGYQAFQKEVKVKENATVKVSATLKKQAAGKSR